MARKKKTTNQFIKEANLKHNNKYAYPDKYVGSLMKIKIICPIHGEFEQIPNSHLKGRGCPTCKGVNKTNNQFTKEANIIHNNKYTYPNCYKGVSHKMIIVCPIHGEFPQLPSAHLSGCGCPRCAGVIKTHDDFVREAKLKHDNKYIYPDNYVNALTKITIICPEHGEFKQIPSSHTQGNGCDLCRNENRNKTQECFIKEANIVHNNKYTYLDKYVNAKSKITIVCPEHGEFKQTPNIHLRGGGCPICACITKSNYFKKGFELFEIEANIVHNNKYTYPDKEYINGKTKIRIQCPNEKHIDFYQTPNKHIHSKQGCPTCKSSKGEQEIEQMLMKYEVEYYKQQKFIKCKDKNQLPFDFYLPKYNLCIEYDGRQHFDMISIFGGEEGLIDRQRKDDIKSNYCIENNINLLRIRYDENIEEKLISLFV